MHSLPVKATGFYKPLICCVALQTAPLNPSASSGQAHCPILVIVSLSNYARLAAKRF